MTICQEEIEHVQVFKIAKEIDVKSLFIEKQQLKYGCTFVYVINLFNSIITAHNHLLNHNKIHFLHSVS